MYCNNCGSEIADGAKFCSNCGTPVTMQTRPEPEPEVLQKTPAEEPDTVSDRPAERPSFAEFQWNVEDYPTRNSYEKTDDVDFNWNADPADIQDVVYRPAVTPSEPAAVQYTDGMESTAESAAGNNDLHNSVSDQSDRQADPESMSAADRIDKFYTFNRKNEEFQQLLNREYEKIKSGNAIEHEMSEASKNADEIFESRPVDSSMEAFLEREGIVKPYQPKAFESDVLQRIEAQEAEKEAKRLEEEARLKAIEEARLEAEAKKKAEEEAKKKAEEEAARLAEIARKKAEEEARAAEAARLKAAEEARKKAEEETRRRLEEEARLRAEAEAKVKAAEEARLRAEADLKAAQEAARIRAQQEARLAAEAEARYRAEKERQKLEAQEAQRRLEEKRKRIAEEANQAAAEEEARKVLEQTSRMHAEEAAKIKAAVANLRAGGAVDHNQTAAPAAAGTVATARKKVEEAHQATRNQINEMAKARTAFFEELEDLREEAEVPDPVKPAPANEDSSRAVTGRATMLSDNDLGKTRIVDKHAILAGIEGATRVSSKKPVPAPASDEEFFNSLDAAAAQADLEADSDERPANEPQQETFAAAEGDLLSQFESISGDEDDVDELQVYEQPEKAVDDSGLEDTVIIPQSDDTSAMAANDFDSYGDEEAANYINQQKQMQDAQQNAAMDDFYGDGSGSGDYEDEEPLSRKELKAMAKEKRRLEKQQAREAKNAARGKAADYEEDYEDDDKGGKGRLVLKIILIILIVILAAEIAGMAIRWVAPHSKAAEFIDTQLNHVIQLFTGDDTEYSFALEPARVDPLEDKTELIASQRGRNRNVNIKSIVYSADLKYDEKDDADISDLVLSQPMTVVEWGKDENNRPVYYDEQVVGHIIAFESNRVNLRNLGDETVLGMINEDSELYKDTAALKNKKMDGEFTRLEIGEIRQAGSNYYVWVRETIGDTTKEKVYSMYPEKQFVMKMAACYES